MEKVKLHSNIFLLVVFLFFPFSSFLTRSRTTTYNTQVNFLSNGNRALCRYSVSIDESKILLDFLFSRSLLSSELQNKIVNSWNRTPPSYRCSFSMIFCICVFYYYLSKPNRYTFCKTSARYYLYSPNRLKMHRRRFQRDELT